VIEREATESADASVLPAARPVDRRGARVWAGAILVTCVGVLGVAAWLEPDPRGYGTHEQFGGGPCGALVMTGYPCPTCGMTTAFAHTVRGQLVAAFWAQPAGLVLALGTVVLAGVAAVTVVRGRWPRVFLGPTTLHRLFIVALVVLLGGWGAKILIGRADGSLPYGQASHGGRDRVYSLDSADFAVAGILESLDLEQGRP
jgi:hypothetical protein